MTEPYAPPLDQFLALGKPEIHSERWTDYLALGVTAEHVPELLRMLSDPALNGDEADEDEFWAPVHAARALGQLRDDAAVEPLIQRMATDVEDDWLQTDIPRALGMIGEAALGPASAMITSDEPGDTPRMSAMYTLVRVGAEHPALNDRAMAPLVERLERWAENDPQFNGELITFLAEARYPPAAKLMEAAFAAGFVDEDFCGDWEDAQVALGLLPERITPRRRILHVFDPPTPLPAGPRPSGGRATGKAESQKKAARKARRKNRRK